MAANAHVRFRRGDVVPLGSRGNHQYVYCRDKETVSLIPGYATQLLDHCGTFKTIEEHALSCAEGAQGLASLLDFIGGIEVVNSRHLSKLLGRIDHFAGRSRLRVRRIADQLLLLVQAGLMVSDAEILEKWPVEKDHCNSPTNITSIVIPTKNRPAILGDTLEGYATNCAAYGHSLTFGLADGSDDPDAVAHNRQAILALGKRFGMKTWYAGRREVSDFASKIARVGGVPCDAVDFGFSGFGVDSTEFETISGPGAARNVALLSSLGEVVISTDDDVVCEIAPVPGSANLLTFSSKPDPTELYFFSSRESAFEFAEFQGQDVVKIHSRLVGKAFGGLPLLPFEYGTPSIEEASPQFLRRLLAGHGRIVATAAGVVGGSGMNSTIGYISTESDSFARLIRSESEYHTALESGELLRGVANPTVSDSAFFMSGNIALDNRELLPPFLPRFRNEDAIFASTLRSCYGPGSIGMTPWVLKHSSPQRKRIPFRLALEGYGSFPACDIIRSLVIAFGPCPEGADPTKRMRALGMFLMDLGGMPLLAYEDFVRVQFCRMASLRLATMERRLDARRRKPHFWARDAERCVAILSSKLTKPESAFPSDLVAKYGESEGRRICQRTTLLFGSLLYYWPDIACAAREVRR